jgi:hypothetical protein
VERRTARHAPPLAKDAVPVRAWVLTRSRIWHWSRLGTPQRELATDPDDVTGHAAGCG